ncbi:hypothetical protein Syun_006152 [Stephania yunnanensis]|uniref:Uncharacterized protein n=1 Tax=Stephania yunnanensis TaxID=152371 RepID=A0AAP0KWE4_9MAGN
MISTGTISVLVEINGLAHVCLAWPGEFLHASIEKNSDHDTNIYGKGNLATHV